MSKPPTYLFTIAVMQAVNALEHLRNVMLRSQGTEYVSAGAMARAINAQETTFRRNIIQLARHGIIDTKHGSGGGYRITQKQLDQFMVLDVIYYLGQNIPDTKGSRASDKLNQIVYDTLDVSLEDFLALE